jgi:cytochrome c5
MRKGQSGKARSGGGITSNKLRQVGMRVAPRTTNVVSVAATDMLGQQVSFKRPDLIRGTAKDFALGNTLTNNVGKGGPGTGRTIYERGFQSCHGTPAKGEAGIQGKADRGSRAILGPPSNTGAVRKGQQVNE